MALKFFCSDSETTISFLGWGEGTVGGTIYQRKISKKEMNYVYLCAKIGI